MPQVPDNVVYVPGKRLNLLTTKIACLQVFDI
jgi:hypothetical protein